MLREFDSLVKQRKELTEWWGLGITLAAHDEKFHSLRVDVAPPAMVSFCGQQYAGAKNYHDAPAFFLNAVQIQMQQEALRITGLAYAKELARLNAEIEKHRDAVLKELDLVPETDNNS